MALLSPPPQAILILLLLQLVTSLPSTSQSHLHIKRDTPQTTNKCGNRLELAREIYNEDTLIVWNDHKPRETQELIRRSALQPGDYVLDLGTGIGYAAKLAKAKVGPTGKVVGVDIADEAIAFARQRLGGGNVEFHVGDFNALAPLLSSLNLRYDVILCSTSFYGVEHPEKVLRSWAQFLKPNGRILFNIQPANTLPDLGALDKAAAQLGGKPLADPRSMVQDSIEEIHLMAWRAGLTTNIEVGKKEKDFVYTRVDGENYIRDVVNAEFFACVDKLELARAALTFYYQAFDRLKDRKGFVRKPKFYYYVTASKPWP